MCSSHSGSHSRPEVLTYLFVFVGILPWCHCHREIRRDVTTQGFTLERHFPGKALLTRKKNKNKGFTDWRWSRLRSAVWVIQSAVCLQSTVLTSSCVDNTTTRKMIHLIFFSFLSSCVSFVSSIYFLLTSGCCKILHLDLIVISWNIGVGPGGGGGYGIWYLINISCTQYRLCSEHWCPYTPYNYYIIGSVTALHTPAEPGYVFVLVMGVIDRRWTDGHRGDACCARRRSSPSQ